MIFDFLSYFISLFSSNLSCNIFTLFIVNLSAKELFVFFFRFLHLNFFSHLKAQCFFLLVNCREELSCQFWELVEINMEDKSGIGPSGVITVKGDEALASRTEFQQSPSFLQFVSPTTVVTPPPPPPPPAPTPASTTVNPGSAAAPPPPPISSAGSDLTKKKRGRPRKYAPDGSLNPRASRPTLSPTPISSSIPFSGDYNHHSHWKRGKAQQQHVDIIKKSHNFEYGSSPGK